MKKLSVILFFFVISLNSVSQSVITISNFPTDFPEQGYLTNDLLDCLNWDMIKDYCDTNEGYYAGEYKKGFITEYKYTKQGYVEYIEIRSFNDFVLEFKAYIPEVSKTNDYYFDKYLWLNYVNTVLPELSDSFKISINESIELLKAYYNILGVDTRDEYGWICEYSAVGMLTKRREAVIELIRQKRVDLLKRLMNYPNLQVKLYAIDALIYINTLKQILSDSD